MSAIASKAAKSASSGTLSKGAKRDPELYILLGIMSSAFGLAGYYFGSKPTSANSESHITISSKPWEAESSGSGKSKYQYHPGGNLKSTPKDAPSALNVVIVPNVNLPKVGPQTLFYMYYPPFVGISRWSGERMAELERKKCRFILIG
ncbi:MAG: hypothetical protein M1813_008138 [Trichoglossum hirsutum]|nr:MAG: hypothetical protein M1813_008138 [Trichoglossum hirsutum]